MIEKGQQGGFLSQHSLASMGFQAPAVKLVCAHAVSWP